MNFVLLSVQLFRTLGDHVLCWSKGGVSLLSHVVAQFLSQNGFLAFHDGINTLVWNIVCGIINDISVYGFPPSLLAGTLNGYHVESEFLKRVSSPLINKSSLVLLSSA
jgi:hypothetical protein